ncbi:hypothetical protein ACJX0J_027145, partial [Zea mays]
EIGLEFRRVLGVDLDFMSELFEEIRENLQGTLDQHARLACTHEDDISMHYLCLYYLSYETVTAQLLLKTLTRANTTHYLTIFSEMTAINIVFPIKFSLSS